jgi:hypothetical protein
MEWSVRGANAIIALRCMMKSGRLEDYWELHDEVRSPRRLLGRPNGMIYPTFMTQAPAWGEHTKSLNDLKEDERG